MNKKISNKNEIQVGDIAPDFELNGTSGQIFRLSELIGKKWIVLYFYPKDNTYGCIAESCAFRDKYEDFLEAGAEVIGISSDTIESHKNFTGKYRLPFTLLSDRENKIRTLYGVPAFLALLPGRTTYLIDKEGVVRYIFSSQFRAESHVKNTLEILLNQNH